MRKVVYLFSLGVFFGCYQEIPDLLRATFSHGISPSDNSGLTMVFIADTEGAGEYNWNFGDTADLTRIQATGKEVSYTYARSGSYKVSLITRTSGLTSSGIVREVSVNQLSHKEDVLILDFNDPDEVDQWTTHQGYTSGIGRSKISDGYFSIEVMGNVDQMVNGLTHNEVLPDMSAFEIETRVGKETMVIGNPRHAYVSFFVKEYNEGRGGDLRVGVLYEDGVRNLAVSIPGRPQVVRPAPSSGCQEITFTIRRVNGSLQVWDDCTNTILFTDEQPATIAGQIGMVIYYECRGDNCLGYGNGYADFSVDYIHVRKY